MAIQTELPVLQEQKDPGANELGYFEDLDEHTQEIVLDLLVSIIQNNQQNGRSNEA